ncbi:MAG TPA: hypothetical protein PLU52_05090 [Opitutaceae bacterium]|nr:hypothetical protein [Opitutaceae bacterium]
MEIVSFGPSGKHNEGIEESYQRILKSALWKRQRIVVIIPAAKDIPTKVALSHWGLVFPPNNAVARLAAIGMEVGEAYSNTIAAVLAHPELSQWEYILTIEHDNSVPPDGLLKLIKRMDENPEFSCIGGLYWCKGEGGVPQIWGDPKDPVTNFRPQPPKPGELVPCNGTGMGFNLWKMDLFKDERLRKPWFKTVAGSEGMATQDLYFWGDAIKWGHKCAVDCDVLVGHYDASTGIVW